MGVYLNFVFIALLTGVLGGIPLGSGVFVYAQDLVLFAGIIYGFILIRKEKHFVVPKVWKPILFFLAAGIVSLLVNVLNFPIASIFSASLYLIRWLLYASLYVLLVQKRIPSRVISYRMFLFGCAFAVLGLLQFVLYPNLRFLLYLGWDPHYYRLFSTLLDPNFAGVLLVLSILHAYYLFCNDRRLSYGIWIGFMVLCVYLTYSRSSYLALLTGAIVYGTFQKQWKILMAALVFILCIFFIPRPGGNTLRLLRDDSTVSRFSNWQQSASLFALSPIFGHGFNTLRYIQTPVTEGQLTFVSHAAAGVDSSILFLLVTSGIVGLSAYIYLLYKAGQSVKKIKDTTQIRHLYVSSIAAICMHSLFVNSLFYPWVMLWLWILIAIMELTYDR